MTNIKTASVVRILRVGLIVAGLVAGAAHATDTFMLVPGIEGDSAEKLYGKWIRLDSFAFTATTHRCKGVTAVKGFDIASPFLGAAVANGDVFPNVTVVVTKRGTAQRLLPILQLKLQDVSMVGVSQVADDITQQLSEQLTLRTFSDIEMTYFSIDPRGAAVPVKSTISCFN